MFLEPIPSLLDGRGRGAMETDLKRIARLSRQREEVNLSFRSYLKCSDYSDAEIDEAVHQLYGEAVTEIDCTSCGNCCRVMGPTLSAAEIKRLAARVGLNVSKFRAQYVRVEEEPDGSHEFRTLPCPFLEDNRCSVYDSRPHDCRSYPHLHKKDFLCRLFQVLDNYSVCPIVFNVYEGLKRRFSKRRRTSAGTSLRI